MDELLKTGAKNPPPVDCLGITFPSDDARREHFLKLLSEKLRIRRSELRKDFRWERTRPF